MTASTAPTAEVIADLQATLARLRAARRAYPDHAEPERGWHTDGCPTCTAQRRLDWLLDRMSTNQRTRHGPR